MTSPRQTIIDATQLTLDRLSAYERGGNPDTALIDMTARKDPEFLAALWSAAFGVAWQLLDRLTSLDSDAARAQMASFQQELEEFRQS